MPDETNAITTYQPSENRGLAATLNSLESQLQRAAEQNVREQAGEGYTQVEMRAMVTVEQLKLVNGLDLAAILLRGRLIRQIEEEALWTVHPGRYTTFDQMAREQGISASELSNVKDLCFVIFPYFEEVLGVPVARVFESIGKSNMRELVPVLKAIITGQPSASQSVNRSVDRIMDDIVVTERAAGNEVGDDDETQNRLRRTAVEQLIEAGQLTNTQLRARIRPERTAALEPYVVNRGARRLVLMEVDEDQYTLLNRRLNGYMDVVTVDLPQDPTQRQREAVRIPVIREVLDLVG